jgi:hypothetical protein
MSISSNSSSASDSHLSYRPPIAIADLVLQPRTSFLQAYVTRDSSTDPGTGMYSRETSCDMDISPAVSVKEVDGEPTAVMEGITTYNAILASTLGMTESTKCWDIPAAAIQEGGFSSLMGVSMAIMEGRT